MQFSSACSQLHCCSYNWPLFLVCQALQTSCIGYKWRSQYHSGHAWYICMLEGAAINVSGQVVWRHPVLSGTPSCLKNSGVDTHSQLYEDFRCCHALPALWRISVLPRTPSVWRLSALPRTPRTTEDYSETPGKEHLTEKSSRVGQGWDSVQDCLYFWQYWSSVKDCL